jgi:F-type H+-transporting ATPase subunit b
MRFPARQLPNAAAALAAVVVVALLPTTALAENGEGAVVPNPGDPGQAIATIVIFLILLAVLGRFAWKPIVAQVRQREQVIADAVRKAEKRERDSADLLESYRQRLERADADAADVLAQGRREAAQLRDQIIQTARDEAAASVRKAREEIDQAKRTALKELRLSTVEMATDMAGQILGRNLDADDQARLLAESTDEIGSDGEGRP